MLRDLNDDSERLLAPGLGRLLPDYDAPVSVVDVPFTPYEDVTGGAFKPVTTSPVLVMPTFEVEPDITTAEAPVIATSTSTLPTLPQFNFSTGVVTCATSTGCATPVAATTAATTGSQAALTPAAQTATAAVSVKPLPEAPKPFNWLLLLAAGAVVYAALRTDKPATLNGPAEDPPAPTEHLAAPPRRAAPKRKHVATLKIS